MAEVLVRYTTTVRGPDGLTYTTQACGGLADDGLWEGWIEFVGQGSAIRTSRETEQHDRDALMYWAQGLSEAYLEGALVRATTDRVAVSAPERTVDPVFSGPSGLPTPRSFRPQRAILDPFTTFAEGEDLLRGQLAALSHDNLVTIAEEYQLGIPHASSASQRVLIDQIVAAAKARTRAA